MEELISRQIKQILGQASGAVLPEELKTVTKAILDMLKDTKDKIEMKMSKADSETRSMCEDLMSDIKKIEKKLSGIPSYSSDINSLTKSLKSVMKEVETLKRDMPSMPDLSVYDEKLEAIMESIPEEKEEKEEKPEELRDKLESLTGDERLDKSAIKGLDEELQSIRSIKSVTSPGMFGMKQMRMVSFSFAGDASTTVFYLPKEPGAKGMAIWAYYQGQHLQLGTHFTVSNKTFTCVGFTPETGSTIEGFIII